MMPFTVITLTRTPPSLKGDLSKWMQEIATGVYVGNFNVKVREQLWLRVKESIGNGEATLSYEKRNEIGYEFESYQTEREMINIEGIPLVLIPEKKPVLSQDRRRGFSQASKFHKIRKFQNKNKKTREPYVIVDIETTGLDENKDHIIEIGAIKVTESHVEEFQQLIKIDTIPRKIQELTGIDGQLLAENGKDIDSVLSEFVQFIEELTIVGYNIQFDIRFINKALKKMKQPKIKNKTIDLQKIVKKREAFLNNYKLETVLHHFGIDKKVPHRALEDVKLMKELISKLNEFEDILSK